LRESAKKPLCKIAWNETNGIDLHNIKFPEGGWTSWRPRISGPTTTPPPAMAQIPAQRCSSPPPRRRRSVMTFSSLARQCLATPQKVQQLCSYTLYIMKRCASNGRQHLCLLYTNKVKSQVKADVNKMEYKTQRRLCERLETTLKGSGQEPKCAINRQHLCSYTQSTTKKRSRVKRSGKLVKQYLTSIIHIMNM
jgi:hypothetical protein